VAVSPNDFFVLVAETGKYRIIRYWLAGPRQGESEVFIENLPGYPDGVSCNGKDTFWVALFSPRDKKLDKLMSKPFLRKIICRLPESLLPHPQKYSFVIGLDVNGKVIHNLQDPGGNFAPVTSVEEFNKNLYLGSVEDSAIGRIMVPEK